MHAAASKGLPPLASTRPGRSFNSPAPNTSANRISPAPKLHSIDLPNEPKPRFANANLMTAQRQTFPKTSSPLPTLPQTQSPTPQVHSQTLIAPDFDAAQRQSIPRPLQSEFRAGGAAPKAGRLRATNTAQRNITNNPTNAFTKPPPASESRASNPPRLSPISSRSQRPLAAKPTPNQQTHRIATTNTPKSARNHRALASVYGVALDEPKSARTLIGSRMNSARLSSRINTPKRNRNEARSNAASPTTSQRTRLDSSSPTQRQMNSRQSMQSPVNPGNRSARKPGATPLSSARVQSQRLLPSLPNSKGTPRNQRGSQTAPIAGPGNARGRKLDPIRSPPSVKYVSDFISSKRNYENQQQRTREVDTKGSRNSTTLLDSSSVDRLPPFTASGGCGLSQEIRAHSAVADGGAASLASTLNQTTSLLAVTGDSSVLLGLEQTGDEKLIKTTESMSYRPVLESTSENIDTENDESDILDDNDYETPMGTPKKKEQSWWHDFVYQGQCERGRALMETYCGTSNNALLYSLTRKPRSRTKKNTQEEKTKVNYRQRYIRFLETIAHEFKNREVSVEKEMLNLSIEKKKIREKMGLDKVPSRFQNIPKAPPREVLISEELQQKLTSEERARINYRIILRQQKYMHGVYQSNTSMKDRSESSSAMKKLADEMSGLASDDSLADVETSSPGNSSILMKHMSYCARRILIESIDESSQNQRPGTSLVSEDMMYWRNRHQLGDNLKIFIICGIYEDIRNELLRRGWVENPDSSSFVFDFKWTTYANDINFRTLSRRQIVNHFENVEILTTKLGLCKSLRQVGWLESEDFNSFYPRCYDLSDSGDLKEFINDYRTTVASNLIKLLVKSRGDIESVLTFDQNIPEAQLKSPRGQKIKRHLINLACRGCEYEIERKSADELFPEDIELDLEKGNILPLTEKEWDLLVNISLRGWKISSELLQAHPAEQEPLRTPSRRNKPASRPSTSRDDFADSLPTERELYVKSLELYEILSCQKQFEMDGTHGIWVVKPSGSSKGFGVRCATDLKTILVGRNENARVVQKYIENPRLIRGRKFDIRQWVLVTSWDPLVIWFYEDSVLRFASELFSFDEPENKYVHLCNYSIQKQNDRPGAQSDAELSWTSDEYKAHLRETKGDDSSWETFTKPAMKEIVALAFRSCQPFIRARQGSCELYGVDFIVDEGGRPWIIEVNSSPGLRASPGLASAMLRDLIKVVIDTNPPGCEPTQKAAPASPHAKSAMSLSQSDGSGDDAQSPTESVPASPMEGTEIPRSADTGRWTLVYKDERHGVSSMADAVGIVVEGHKMTIEKGRAGTHTPSRVDSSPRKRLPVSAV